jgi:DNA mismatch endonuclease, patch repair protein
MDILSKEKRSWNMSRIRGKDTRPEVVVRSTLHRMGYRFRIHVKGLPGCPDIVLPKYRAVIFVHGCFWHRHPGCKYAYIPKSRQDFWTKKFQKTVERHEIITRELEGQGWKILVVWECEIVNTDKLRTKLIDFIE